MNVTLCSAFRNSAAYIPRYCQQVHNLACALQARGDKLECIWGEGDSADNTREVLEVASAFYDAEIVDVSHGGPDYGSIVNAERFANLAKVWNAIWARIPANADVVIFCESDLIWDADTMLQLLGDLEHLPPPYGAVAPMIMLKREGFPERTFYDYWAFERNGKRFTNQLPFHPDIKVDSDLLELDSAGSLLVMDGELARKVEWPAADVVRGICRQILCHGGSIFLDTTIEALHE